MAERGKKTLLSLARRAEHVVSRVGSLKDGLSRRFSRAEQKKRRGFALGVKPVGKAFKTQLKLLLIGYLGLGLFHRKIVS